jgi:hypothetical protein
MIVYLITGTALYTLTCICLRPRQDKCKSHNIEENGGREKEMMGGEKVKNNKMKEKGKM